MMKFLLSFFIGLASFATSAQVSVYDCQTFDPVVTPVALEAIEPGTFHKPCVLLDSANTYQFDIDDQMGITADKSIHIQEDFHAGQFSSTGNMHLQIKPETNFDVLVMNYSDLNNVERFGKLELAVVLPQNIQTLVEDFVQNGQSPTNVNPFDPQQLEIKAYFSPLYLGNWQNPWLGHGFYYENFERSADTLSWDTIPTPGSNFRIRFAPRATGLYRCLITVNCPVTGQYFDLNEFQFNVVDVGLPDFMRVGENGKYFKIGGEPFYPFGMNMPTQGRATAYTSEGTQPKDYVKFFSELRELSDAGGNYFRYMNMPYSTEVEFEVLGDYSDRMHRAWEMDQLVDSLSDLGLRMHYCLTYTLPLTYTGVFSQYWWDWSAAGEAGVYCDLVPNGFTGDPGYCYHTDSVYGVALVDDFFTDPDLMRYYKNRLRYYVSRWGYSTRIGTFEFVNEINFSGVQYGVDSVNCQVNQEIFEVKPYFEDANYVQKLSSWQGEMARYIKEDLQHTEHLITVDYGGAPNEVPLNNYDFSTLIEDGISTYAGDSSYLHEHIDIRAYSDYDRHPTHFIGAVYEIIDYRNNFSHEAQKPFFFAEIGIGLHGCDNQYTYQQLYLMSMFTGAAGAGLPWEYNINGPLWDSVPERLKGWEPMTTLPLFLDGIDFNQEDWEPGATASAANKSEAVYLRNNKYDAGKAIGIISNRTVNRYTMREVEWCDTLDSNGESSCDCYLDSVELTSFPNQWKFPIEIGPIGQGDENDLKIWGFEPYKNYFIEYYNVQTGSMTGIQQKYANGYGQIKLDFPTLSATPEASNGNANGSMILMKVYRTNMSGLRTTDTTDKYNDNKYIFDLRAENLEKDREIRSGSDLQSSPQILAQNAELFVIPNPTDGAVEAFIRGEVQTSGTWRVLNVFGQVVFEESNVSSAISFDTRQWNSGLYLVHWTDGENRLSTKLMVK